jgi:thiol-disulfide isomerase/thioredoxin
MPPSAPAEASGFGWGAASWERSPDGAAVLTVAVDAGAGAEAESRVEAVLLDRESRTLRTVRYPRRTAGGNVVLYRFDLGKMGDDAAQVGVEWATPDGLRALAEESRARAESLGVAVLPFPEIGAPYVFDLDLGPGGAVRAAEYQGKVVLLDCWATWCAPCMQTRKKLRQIHERYRERGFDIVGVNFDFDRAAAESVLAKEGEAWRNVFVGVDPSTLDLWYDAARVGGVPHHFLVDAQGVLRWDRGGADMAALVAKLEEILPGS